MIRRLGVITALVLQVTVLVISGLLLGGWLDKLLGIEMVFQIAFTLLGGIAGFYRLLSFLQNNASNSS